MSETLKRELRTFGRRRSTKEPVVVVGIKDNPYNYGDSKNSPVLKLSGLKGLKTIKYDLLNTGIERKNLTKITNPASYTIMQIKPIENEDLLIWINPLESPTRADVQLPRFEIYLEFGIPPDPDRLVFFKDKIEVSNSS